MVFKGGTSLTKCYQILDRFSEDIDISYAASEGIPGESRKRQLKKAVVSSIESMGFSVANLEETRSRRSYNCYRASYSSIYSPLLELKPELVIETYIALLPFPTVNRMADNYIYRFLKMTEQEVPRGTFFKGMALPTLGATFWPLSTFMPTCSPVGARM
ncbi:nucleotidyl transferase AbiEii/AbiGii toxin family protein [uncultured Akkermansia sp.]|uniref:nucleotidyl transferase AbiEii/AbiGii toxin family protein n=1 Tax=uncultured Akkermansia sp. TaxID=512294 RepID=UPI0031F2DF03